MTTAELLNVLAFYQGHERGIRMADLARVCGDVTPRELRKLISALREEGHAICATPAHGYYLATTPEELRESCKFLHDRAMHSLRRASQMQRISLPDLMGQLLLNQA